MESLHSHSDIRSFFKLLTSKSPQGQLLRIQLSVLITIILLVALFFLGRIRRFVRVGWFLRYATKIIYILIPIAITYIMGLMHNTSTRHVLYPVWACALIYAYGGVITMTACDLSDNDDNLPYFCRMLPLLFWTYWLALSVPFSIPALQLMWVTIFGLFVVAASWNTVETLEAFYLASKSKGLPGLVGPVVQYMREAKDVPDELVADPVSMRGYRYVVWGDPAHSIETSITTTEEVWASVGGNFLATFVGAERLRDMCLSYAFFRLILRRFAYCPLYESSKRKTRRFVRDGLLSADLGGQQQISERVFNVIEVELAFLFNFFYTKSCVRTSYKYVYMGRPLLHALLLLLFGTVGISFLVSLTNSNDHGKSFNVRFHGHSLEVGVTRIVALVFSLLEIWKFVKVCFSKRRMVWLLCTSRLSREVGTMDKMIVCIWTIKDHLCKRYGVLLSKPWQRRLGQYSFLDSYGQVPLLARKQFSPLATFAKLPRVGQCGELSVALSTQVKQAIVTSLLPHVQDEALQLSRGTATTARHDLPVEISDACKLETDAHVILVWHIATCICELFHAPQNSNDHFLVATQLSKYCAYLVSFAPELLPDQPYTTESVFDMAVKQAQRDIRGSDMLQQYQNLTTNNDFELNGDDNLVVKGVLLAGALIEHVVDTPNRGWRVLAEFWAELLLYLALSDNVAVHGEYLARGGEFITHIWALLTHAGIVATSTN